MPRSVSFVLPALNEEGAIGPTLETIPVKDLEAEGWDVEILVVDGESTDGTVAEAEEHGARVLTEPRKGYGRAYRTGLPAAKGDVLITGDADGTYPFELAPQLLKQLDEEDLDFITCDRFHQMEKGAMSARNKFWNRVLTITGNALFGVRINDSQSGMWVIRKTVLDQVIGTHDGMPFSEEIKVRAFRALGDRAKEVGVPYRPRLGDVKLNAVQDGLLNLGFFFRWKLGMHRPKAPTKQD